MHNMGIQNGRLNLTFVFNRMTIHKWGLHLWGVWKMTRGRERKDRLPMPQK